MFQRKFFWFVILGLFSSILTANLTGCGGKAPALSVAVTASASTVDGNDTTTLSATVTNDKNAAGVTWSVSSGGTLSNKTTTSATFTAAAPASSSQTVTITATSIADTSKSGTATITIPAMPALMSTNANLAGSVGSSYSVTLQASGGIPPYSWALGSGTTLPACLTLKSTGVLTTTSGAAPTASCAGTYSNITFQITDSGTPTALTTTSSAMTVTITAPSITFSPTLPAGAVGTAYTGSVAAAGPVGATTYSIAGGALPPDLSLNTTTGAITGTPKAADVGTSTFTISVLDAYGDTATSGSLSITIAAAPAITFGGAPTATAKFGVAYSSSVTASGGAGSLTYSVASGALPPDLTLSASGAITGTPKASDIGTFTFAVKASDAFGDSATSGNYSIVVSYPAVTITPGAGSLPFAVTGQSYSQTLTAAGGSGSGFTWSVTGLPASGITYSASGATLTISGPATTAGTVNFSATATDNANNSEGPLAYSIQVYSPVTIPATIPASLPSVATVNVAYTGTIVATGGSGNYSWTVSGLSDGLTSSTSGGTLTISGTPTSAATVTPNVTVKDTTTGLTSGPYAYAITVYASVTLPTSNPSTLGPAIVSTPYSGTILAAGGSGNYSWTVTGLPADNLNESTSGGTLTISGTPGSTPATVSFTAKVTDTATNLSSGPYNYSVTVYNAVTLNASSLPSLANANAAYSGSITASGGSGTGYVWSVTGLSDGLSSSASGGTLIISGTPASAATVSFTASVKDSVGNSAGPASYTITVYGALALPASNPSSLPSGYTSVAYSGTINASGGSGNYAWTVTGLPSDNLNSSASGGMLTISGTPGSTPTTVSFTAKVTDTTTNASVGPYNYSIAITTPVAVTLPPANPSSLGPATQNESYSGAINASGGVGPYTWSINGTTLPSSGLSYSLGNGTLAASSTGGNTLVVSGTPSTAGTVTLANVKVVDSLNSSATNTYTITVNSQTPLTLPLPSTNPLPQGTVNQAYNGAINASGGVGSNYSFTVAVGSGTAQSVPINGTPLSLTDGLSATNTGGYTLVISGTPTAAAAVTLTVTVKDSANDTASETYTFNIINPSAGYSVSGTVTYTGSLTGWVYLQLVPSNCNGCSGTLGTAVNATTSGALASGAPFTIHGVPPGTYMLRAFMDNIGYGAENASNPTGSVSGVTVTSSGLSGQSITLTNPAPVTLSGTPTWDPGNGSGGFNGGAVISFDIMYNANYTETPASYEVQYSTSSSFSGTPGSKCFPANGGNNPWVITGLTNNSTYYFRAAGNTGACGSSTTGLTYSPASSGVAIGAPTSGSLVSGTVTWTGAVTGTLYVGCYASNTGNVYADPIASPVSPQSYSVYVPNGTNCELFGFIDQNNTGIIGGPGEISNTNNGIGMVSVTVNGTMPNENLTLPSGNSIAEVKTETNSGGNSTSYNIGLQVYGLLKLPVSVELLSESPKVSGTAADVVMPADFASGAFKGETDEFDYWPSVTGTPVVGDSYTFNVTYSDGTSEQLTAAVTGVLSAFATDLSPAGSGVSTTPSFSWIDPSSASSYVYQFQLTDSNGNTIWQIPPQHSASNGFSSSITSITWGVDPTNTGDLPSVSSLNSSSTYSWSIAAYDSNMNEAQVQTSFQTAESTLALPAAGTFNALQNAPFSEGLTATGGSGSGYVFTLALGSGTAQTVPNGGTPLALTDGLSAVSNGSTLTISGTPTAVEAVTLNVSVTDSASHSAGPVTYTVNVVSAPSGVNNGNLKGTYVCKVNGYDDNDNSEWASLGSFVLNGSGSLTSGIWDTNGQDFTAAETGTTTGTYSIGADNNGVMTTNSVITSGATGSPSITWAVALSNATSPAQEFQMVETDDVGSNASGMHSAGLCYLATPSAFALSTFNGGFVASSNGASGAGIPAVSLNLINVSNGTVTSGYSDNLTEGSATDTIMTFTGGSFSTPDPTFGRSTLTINTSGGSGTFAVYIIDTNRMFILMTGAVHKAQSGDMRKQQQTSYSAANFDGAAVLYSQAYQYQNSAYSYYSSVYQVSGNGAGSLTVNQSYDDKNGTYAVGNEKGGTATVTFDTSNPGRATFSPGSDTAFLYFFNNNSALYMDFNGSEGWLESGWLEPQSQTTFTDAALAGDYMFGVMPVVMEPTTSVPIGEFDLLSNGAYTDEVTLAGMGSFTFDQSGSGTYSWDTSATGTGSFLEGSGSSGTSCIVISSTRAACILNTDNSPSVLILQQ